MQISRAESINSSLSRIKKSNPVICNITNFVSANFCANALLSIGASPLMISEIEEVEEIIKISDALALNIGTLHQDQIKTMLTAIEFANVREIPIVIDPVGAGASKLRTQTARELLLKSKRCVLKGNASEILSIAGHSVTSKGVDSDDDSSYAIEAAQKIKNEFQTEVVAITGEIDFVIDKSGISKHSNGSLFMSQITGMGCALTSQAAAFLVNSEDFALSVRNAVSFYGLCGEIAENESKNLGTYLENFITALNSTNINHYSKSLKGEKC